VNELLPRIERRRPVAVDHRCEMAEIGVGLDRLEQCGDEIDLLGWFTARNGDAGDEGRNGTYLFDECLDRYRPGERSAVDGTDVDTDITECAQSAVNDHKRSILDRECTLGARTNADSAARAGSDRVWVVAGGAVEVAALEEDDEAVARSVYDREPDGVIDLA